MRLPKGLLLRACAAPAAVSLKHLSANDNHSPPFEIAASKKASPKFGERKGVDKALALEAAQRKQQAADQAAVVDYEVNADEIAAARVEELRRKAGIPYDLSDAQSLKSIPQEVRELYPDLVAVHRLPVRPDPLDLTDRDLIQWCNAIAYPHNPIDLTVDKDAKHEINRLYGGVRSFITDAVGHDVANAIRTEWVRREAWGWANRRLHVAAALSCENLDGRDLEDVLDELARFDYQTEAALTGQSSTDNSDEPAPHKQYIAIIDALRWPLSLSRRELVARARPDHNPDHPLACSPFDGPAQHIPDWRRHPRQPRPQAVDIVLDQLRASIPPSLPLSPRQDVTGKPGL